ncbi:hypothetical protein [Phenylobacterium sp.]|uniref:hypothetical protein n=1 Tax=Phenylobacterium sp. TaxID=1871053 RepID=UPI002896925E|nr:hypothetical protein [Phenylobacterium sp.]
MAARLKVFVTSDGFTDYVVAASSRAKALAAWGAHQDLFQTGGARETDDPELVAAATARPGEVIRRPATITSFVAGRKGPRAAPPLPKSPPPKSPPPKSPAPKAAPQPRRPRGPTPAQLRKVAELEAELEAAAEQHAAELAEIAAEKRALELRRDASESRFLIRRAEFCARRCARPAWPYADGARVTITG